MTDIRFSFFLFLTPNSSFLLCFCWPIPAVACATASAFAPAPFAHRGLQPLSASTFANEVDAVGNNVAVKNLLIQIEEQGLLTKVAQSGLLSKAEKAGLSLTKLEPLLALVAQNKEVLILIEASTPELLPILPKVVELAPGALPLLASAVSIPPEALSALGLLSIAGAVGAVVVIPDDTVVEVATQTLAVGVLGAAGVASFAGSAILSKLFK